MRTSIGVSTDGTIDRVIERLRAARDLGYACAWSSHIFGPDTLTYLAVAAREVDTIEIGTAVVPVQPRHPAALAQQARTVQAVSNGRLTLGVGLSHQVVVEQLWGLSFEHPVAYLREYLAVLAPMLRGEAVRVEGEFVTATATGPVGPEVAQPPGLVVAALGPRMLALAGTVADGTATWMTGPATLRDHIAPTIRDAAAAAGRPVPRVIASLPVCVTDDIAGARERIDTELAIYPTLPSYRAMLDREGASTAADVALIGSAEQVRDAAGALADAGVTEFVCHPTGTRAERDATIAALAPRG